jgi:hypothetical protein
MERIRRHRRHFVRVINATGKLILRMHAASHANAALSHTAGSGLLRGAFMLILKNFSDRCSFNPKRRIIVIAFVDRIPAGNESRG